MKIRTKLFLSFALMVALIFSLNMFNYNHLTQSQVANKEVLADGEIRYELMTLQYLLAGMSNDERAFLLTKDAQYQTGIVAKETEIEELLTTIKSNSTLEASDLEVVTLIEQKYREYVQASDNVFAAIANSDAAAAKDIHFNEERTARKELNAVVAPLLDKVIAEMDQDVINHTAAYNQQTINMSVFLITGIVIALLTGWIVSRSITRPIRRMEVQMNEIAHGDGDLSRDLILNSKDEIADLAHSFNQMIRNIRSILSQAQDTAIQVAASSEQLTASSEQTSLATEQIVDATQLIAANTEKEQQHVDEALKAVQQMSTGIQQVSSVNEEVLRLAQSATEASTNGIRAVQDVLQGMKAIELAALKASAAIQSLELQSKQIHGITTFINDLANRTNLLSLNAGIEAARAGEHGKGFAIVAQEIRKLADQSGNSAQQISELIEGIVAETQLAVTAMQSSTLEVGHGLTSAELVNQVFLQIEENVAAVSKQLVLTSTTTLQLAASSNQIVVMVEEVSQASNEVAASCQSNSASTEEQLATMEEISSSSQALSKLAEDLHQVLARFKLQ